MSTHDDYMTKRQARDLARRLARLERRQRSTAAAHADLRHSAIDGGKGLVLKDEQGQEKYRLGTDENGVTAPQYKGGPTPEQPSEPFVDVGGEVVKIQHSGLDVDENPAPADFRRAQIHVAQDESFEPSLSSLAGYLEETDGSFTHRLPGGEWYIGVVWETLSGKRSAMSSTVLADVAPLVDTQDIEDTLAEAEQIIADAVAAAQLELDELRDRLDNFEEYDPSDLIAQINQVTEDLADARQEATGMVADLADRVDDIKIPDVSEFITQSEVDAAAQAAEDAAKQHADLVAQGAEDAAIAEAQTLAQNARESAETAAKQYADQQDALTLQSAATDAQTKADAAQAEAERLAAEHAELVATGAKDDAIAEAERLHDEALAKAEAAQSKADEAHQDAGAAYIHADAAMTLAGAAESNAKEHADNLPKMLGGTTAPTGTAPNGSVWFQRDSTNTVIGRWERIDGSWVQQEVSGELIDNLEAGKITALHTEFAESVIGKLWTQLAIVDRLIATSAWIGGAMIGEDAVEAKHVVASETLSGKVAEFLKLSVADLVATGAQVDDAVIQKLWVDGLVGLSATLARATIASNNLYPDPKFENAGRYGSWTVVDGGIEKSGTGSQSGAYYTDETIAAAPGDSFRISANITWVNGTSGRTSLIVRTVNAAGSLIGGTVVPVVRIPQSEEGGVEGVYTVPEVANVAGIQLGFYTENDMTSGTRVRVENPRIQNMLDGNLVVEDTIRTRHLHVTREMVGEFASFMHLVVDQIDVNSLWADQTWQAAGYFGSSEADQQTRIDGTGLRISKSSPDDETTTDLVRLGGEGIGLTFQDEDGNVTGSLQHDGDATLKDVNAHSLTMAGRPLQDPACNDYLHPSGDQSLLTFRPRGVAGWNTRGMPAFNSDYREWGFMDVTANLYAGRMYRISVGPIYTFADNTTNQLRIRYTDDGTVVRIVSPILARARYGTQAGQHGSHISGEWYFTPDHTGQHSFLATIYNGQGVRLPAGYTGDDGSCWLVVEDIGLAPLNQTGQDRDTRGNHVTSGINNEDEVGGIQTYTTTWTADWFQSYRNNGNTPATDGYGAEKPRQGYRELDNQFYTSIIGFAGATESTDDTELGQTFQAALAGATVRSIILEVTGEYSRRQNNTFYRILTSGEPSAPPTYTPSGASPRHLDNYRVDVGQTRRITLPSAEHGDSLKNGAFQAIGLSPLGNSDLKYTGGLSWRQRPRITITYQR